MVILMRNMWPTSLRTPIHTTFSDKKKSMYTTANHSSHHCRSITSFQVKREIPPRSIPTVNLWRTRGFWSCQPGQTETSWYAWICFLGADTWNLYLGISWNRATPKSSILTRFPQKENIHVGGIPMEISICWHMKCVSQSEGGSSAQSGGWSTNPNKSQLQACLVVPKRS